MHIGTSNYYYSGGYCVCLSFILRMMNRELHDEIIITFIHCIFTNMQYRVYYNM